MIFDFDGTLADSGEWFAGVFNEVARRYRFREATRSDLEAMRGLTAIDVMRRVGLPRWKLPFVARHMRRMMTRDIAQIRLFPGVASMVQGLAASGMRLALVSSNARENIELVLGPELAACFETYACGASLFGKSGSFRKVLQRSQVPASCAIGIGDEVRDVVAAKTAGMSAGAVLWGYATEDALRAARPDAMFATVEALQAWLLDSRDSASGPRSSR